MSIVHSFPPIASSHSKILILGSMPSEASLAANQYYAHPRNAFWPIISHLLHIQPDAPYQHKIGALQASPIALWDVLKSCQRSGSLDSSIESESLAINDFQAFFSAHRQITHVLFNGGTAESCFKRYVLPATDWHPLTLIRLPSTSPANARLPFAEKCRIWHGMIDAILQ